LGNPCCSLPWRRYSPAIKSNQNQIREFENFPVKSYTFDSYDIENMDIAALLFQTGYLTIKKIAVKGIIKTKTYYLSYPNQEVRVSFLTYLLESL
jgi:hypothetical protein